MRDIHTPDSILRTSKNPGSMIRETHMTCRTILLPENPNARSGFGGLYWLSHDTGYLSPIRETCPTPSIGNLLSPSPLITAFIIAQVTPWAVLTSSGTPFGQSSV